jgi:hypothetical protein
LVFTLKPWKDLWYSSVLFVRLERPARDIDTRPLCGGLLKSCYDQNRVSLKVDDKNEKWSKREGVAVLI